MKTAVGFSVERAREMDRLYGQRVNEFCTHVRLFTVEHEDNAIALLSMAHALGVDFDELCQYVYLRTYLKELACDAADAPDPSLIARALGVHIRELMNYLRDQAHERSFEEDGVPVFSLSCQDPIPVGFPWETEEALEQDLLADAGYIRYGE